MFGGCSTSTTAGQINESSGTSDEAEASRQLKVKVGEAASGRTVAPGRATVGDLCALVVADYELRGLRDLRAMRWRFKANVERLIGKLPAARLGDPCAHGGAIVLGCFTVLIGG